METDRFTIMDDCYNANPISTKAGLDVLAEAEERKVAILGDMFELGSDERKLHYEVGEYAAIKVLTVLYVRENSQKNTMTVQRQQEKQRVCINFATRDEAVDRLKNIVKENDAILVKASHGMKFEKIVEVLKQM